MLTVKDTNNLFKKFLPENSDEINEMLYQYYVLIETENQKYNLTGFHNEKLILEGIIESILVFKEINQKVCDLKSKYILDIGAGAGFPSLPYYIYTNQNFNLTIYESLKKRCVFLELVKQKLNLGNLTIKNIRAEDSSELEKFNFITARAVSELKNLIQISYHLGKLNNCIFCFLKSNNYLKELENSQKYIKELNLHIKTLEIICNNIKNVIVYYQKEKQTPKDYPRKWSQIIK